MISTRLPSLISKCVKSRAFTSSAVSSAKVAVLGAAGGIGQPLSMLCKLSENIDELSCYDIVGTPGVAADLSHVSFFLIFHSIEYTKVSIAYVY